MIMQQIEKQYQVQVTHMSTDVSQYVLLHYLSHAVIVICYQNYSEDKTNSFNLQRNFGADVTIVSSL